MDQLYLELALAEGCGPGLVPTLLDPQLDPERLRHDPELDLPPAVRRRLNDPGLTAGAHRMRARAEALGWSVLTPADDRYPGRLRHAPLRPLVLFAHGDLELLDPTMMAVTVVGSRTPTPYGRAAAATFSTALAGAGLPIWSGLAFGVDAIAHQSCLDLGRPTVAVLPGGPDTTYPRSHAPLLEQIVRKGGLALTEAPPGLRPSRGHFPRRNRILAQGAAAVLVVEAGLASGTLHTARFAADHGTPLFAIPGPWSSPRSRGCHRLLGEGAQIAADPSELLHQLGVSTALQGGDARPLIASAEAQAILDVLASGPRPTDLVRRETRLEEEHFLRALFELIESGRVIQLRGDLLGLGANGG